MKDPWFKLFTSDYLNGVSDLSDCERGVYTTLFVMMYDRGGPIERDDEVLARRCGSSGRASFRRILDRLLEKRKIVESSGLLFNFRAKKEMEKSKIKGEKASESARARWEKSMQNQYEDSEIASKTHAFRIENASRFAMLPESRSQNPESYREEDKSSSLVDEADLFGSKTKKITRSESDEKLLDQVTDVWNAWAQKHGCPQVKMLTKTRGVKCRQRLAEITNGHGPVVAFEELLGRCEQSFFVKGSPRSPLHFDQLLSESFMVKMIEGKYDYRAQDRDRRQWQK